MFRALAAASILALFAMPALAADNGFYLGGSIGQGNVQADDDDLGVSLDAEDTGFKLIVGFRPLDFFAVEANYVDLGKPEDDILGVNVTTDANGIDAFAVGLLPLGPVDLFAKAGFVHWEAELTADGIGSVDDSGEDFAYGVGAAFRLGSLAIRAEYEVFEIADFDDVNMLSLGVTWTFF